MGVQTPVLRCLRVPFRQRFKARFFLLQRLVTVLRRLPLLHRFLIEVLRQNFLPEADFVLREPFLQRRDII